MQPNDENAVIGFYHEDRPAWNDHAEEYPTVKTVDLGPIDMQATGQLADRVEDAGAETVAHLAEHAPGLLAALGAGAEQYKTSIESGKLPRTLKQEAEWESQTDHPLVHLRLIAAENLGKLCERQALPTYPNLLAFTADAEVFAHWMIYGELTLASQ